ncbi:MAG: hypothetical protein AB9891_00405 [Anaerolineaceae bacterium]
MTVSEDFLSKQIQSRWKVEDGDIKACCPGIKLELFCEERTRRLLNFLIKLLDFD